MRSIAADLQQYLMEAASTPFAYGHHDCSTFAADWCIWRGHSDPMARWRTRYAYHDEADWIIAQAGGLLPLWELGMIEAQIPECDSPQIGDVAVLAVMTPDGPDQVGGIFGGKRWHMLAPSGLFCASMAPEHVLKTWRVG